MKTEKEIASSLIQILDEAKESGIPQEQIDSVLENLEIQNLMELKKQNEIAIKQIQTVVQLLLDESELVSKKDAQKLVDRFSKLQ